jgi:hypothetical protein
LQKASQQRERKAVPEPALVDDAIIDVENVEVVFRAWNG